MPQPKVDVTIGNNNLGNLAVSGDGTSAIIVSGIAVSGKFALGDVLGPFTSVADAEALGIDEAYDAANNALAHKHISDFYLGAPAGTNLYVMVVVNTLRMTSMADKTLAYAKKLLSGLNGQVKLIGFTMCPDGAYAPSFSGQFEADLWTAITKIKALVADEATSYRYVRALIEGRNFQGSASSSEDMSNASTGPNANVCGVVIGNDNDFAVANAYAANYASVGYALGVAAGLPVQRSIARVKNGPLAITNAGFSNGAVVATLTDAQLDTLHDHRYIFLKQFSQLEGFFFNKDNMACPLTDDYNTLKRGRVMDKAARITRDVYVNDIEDEVDVDPTTGNLPVGTCKAFQSEIEAQIEAQMVSKGELTSVTAFVDAAQDILSTDNLNVQLNLVPKGDVGNISVALAYSNPSNS